VHTPDRRACGEGTGSTSTRRHHDRPSSVRTSTVTLLAGAALATGVATPATAQPVQDGLINVAVGDVTILEDVRVALAAQVAAQTCCVSVGPVAVLGRAVDRNGRTKTVCESDQGRVTLRQNGG